MLNVEQWPIERLIPYARNPRKNDAQVDRMCAAIREFGFRIPIVAKSDGTVVDGHLRLKAAQKLGLKDVPVALADELSDVQVKAFRLLANQSANWAEWDNELLALELEELKLADFDTDLIGFEAELFEPQEDVPVEDKYTAKATTPIYEPTGRSVCVDELYDQTKDNELAKAIHDSTVSPKEKAFSRLLIGIRFSTTRTSQSTTQTHPLKCSDLWSSQPLLSSTLIMRLKTGLLSSLPG